MPSQVHIDTASEQTVSIIRYTANQRTASTTIHTGVVMDIQPAGGGADFTDMSVGAADQFHGFVRTALANVRKGDVVRLSDGTDLYIRRLDSSAFVQEFILANTDEGVL